MQSSEANMMDDADLQLLEALLDNELTSEQGEQLRKRLAVEPALAAELEKMRAEREGREGMYLSWEGGGEAGVGSSFGGAEDGGLTGTTGGGEKEKISP